MDKNKPIIRLLFAKIKEAFYNLPEEEMKAFMIKDRKNLDELGCKWWLINCCWSTEEWDAIGIEEWPSLEALEKRAKFENEVLQKFRIIKSKTYLGTRESSDDYGKELDFISGTVDKTCGRTSLMKTFQYIQCTKSIDRKILFRYTH